MTNYNERLDEILDKFGWTCVADGGNIYGLQNEDISEAKQALTSLIKELVAEAKPERQSTENMGDTFKVNWARGYNLATDEFEQNLLKVLEEK